MTANQTLGKRLFDAHSSYKESSLTHRRFKHTDILPLLDQCQKSGAIVSQLGKSIEDRSIFEVNVGLGRINIMLWTQMHGNEPTSTMAIFDILHFLLRDDDEFSEVRSTILMNLKLYFIPMLNPDGVERFQRRNAAEVDLNRDAVAFACPESRILKAAHDKNKPVFGFNLHDQSIHYNVPGTANTATHSFLAPAYDYDKSINETRGNAMKGIALMQEILDVLHPNHSGRYNDDFEPRAFGDNIQSWGTSTILVEAGGMRGDPDKQEIRRMHFSILLALLYNIANGDVEKYSIDQYWAIPENDRKLNDLIIRNVSHPQLGKCIDISINKEEIDILDTGSYYTEAKIEDLGDLSTFYGYEEKNVDNISYIPCKIYEKLLTLDEAYRLDYMALLQEGIGVVRVKDWAPDNQLDTIPLMLIDAKENLNFDLVPGNRCSFFLGNDTGIKFAVINGKITAL